MLAEKEDGFTPTTECNPKTNKYRSCISLITEHAAKVVDLMDFSQLKVKPVVHLVCNKLVAFQLEYQQNQRLFKRERNRWSVETSLIRGLDPG